MSTVDFLFSGEYVAAPYEVSWVTCFHPPKRKGPRRKWLKVLRRARKKWLDQPGSPTIPDTSGEVTILIRDYAGKWRDIS